jgi:DNA-binding PadR family transcriptional regulator
MVQFIVLGLLRGRGPRHGYALVKEYEARAGARVNSGTFYRALRRLEREALVQIVAAAEAGDPRRALYEITPRGEAAIERWLARPRTRSAEFPHDELSARAALIGVGHTEAARRGLERWRDDLVVLVQATERALAKAVDGDDPLGPPATRALILARHLRRLAADLEFIDQLRAVYQPPRPPLTHRDRVAPEPPPRIRLPRRAQIAKPRRGFPGQNSARMGAHPAAQPRTGR